ncbi:MAG TPA: hypothetical protein VH250_07915 [Granulicella sp.]|jgi:hypothetical protein|nr:hypothetical protein [Granulicella sp.]
MKETAMLATFEAVVTDIRLESRVSGRARWQIALDRTLFSAAAQRGVLEAVARSGARLVVPVLGVVEEDGMIWHVSDKPLTEGTAITARLGGEPTGAL